MNDLEINGDLLTRGSGWDDPPRPKRRAPRGLLPSTWIGREINVEYDAGGDLRSTGGVLLDTYPAGPVLNVLGGKTLIGWDRLVLIELLND